MTRREKVGIKNWRDSKVFIDYLQAIDDVVENLEDYNSTKKRKLLIEEKKTVNCYHDMITDIDANKKLSQFFLRGRKFKI